MEYPRRVLNSSDFTADSAASTRPTHSALSAQYNDIHRDADAEANPNRDLMAIDPRNSRQLYPVYASPRDFTLTPRTGVNTLPSLYDPDMPLPTGVRTSDGGVYTRTQSLDSRYPPTEYTRGVAGTDGRRVSEGTLSVVNPDLGDEEETEFWRHQALPPLPRGVSEETLR